MSERENIHAGHRERMMKRLKENKEALLEHELLEMLLFATLPRINTNPIAHRLLKVFGSLNGVFNASVEELFAINGVGEKTAMHLCAIGQAFKRASSDNLENKELKNFEMVKKEVVRLFEREKHERFCLFLLSQTYKKVAVIDFYDKDTNAVSVGLSDVAKAFAIYKPKNVIIAHNHPSGLKEPSEKDDFATMKINLICMAHSVNLTDHVIYTQKGVYSYMQSGKLDEIKKKADLNKLLNSL